jgi:ubiquinone/menaquinone biosynthesis C-methylase UbiE
MAETNEHPERFDPATSSGTLMDAEHRCRYWWAAQAASGKDVLDAACGTGYGSLILAEVAARSVTGIDISAEAVNAAKETLGQSGTAVLGDIAELPFEDDSFDLVVCLETVEHVADAAAVVAEFRRVLRDDGVLLVSSPNPGVYPEGNEHHVHEYSPEELTKLLEASFPYTVQHMQHAWISSLIQPVDAARTMEELAPAVKALSGLAPGEQTYTLIAAGHGELPDLDALVTLGGTFEVNWWSEQLERERAELRRTKQQLGDVDVELEKAQIHATEIEHQLTRELAATFEREQAAGKRLSEANGRILGLSEEIGRLRVLEKHLGELKGRELGVHYEVAVTRLNEIESSRAWKWIEALRGVRARLR